MNSINSDQSFCWRCSDFPMVVAYVQVSSERDTTRWIYVREDTETIECV